MALGSVTLGLPWGGGASLDVLGKEGTLSQCNGPARTHQHSPPSPGYLGYASGFSLSCMVFFLISVSMWHLLALAPAGALGC